MESKAELRVVAAPAAVAREADRPAAVVAARAVALASR